MSNHSWLSIAAQKAWLPLARLTGRRPDHVDNNDSGVSAVQGFVDVRTLQDQEAIDGQPITASALATIEDFKDGSQDIPHLVIQEEPQACNLARTYSCQLGSIHIHVSATTWYGERNYSGTLTQDDGGWMVFNPLHPADKILRHDLVMTILPACLAMVEADQQYMSSDAAKTFLDTDGYLWTRSAISANG